MFSWNDSICNFEYDEYSALCFPDRFDKWYEAVECLATLDALISLAQYRYLPLKSFTLTHTHTDFLQLW